MTDDDIPARATRRALSEVGDSEGSLSTRDQVEIAMLAAYRALRTLDPTLDEQQRETAVTLASRTALMEAHYWTADNDRRKSNQPITEERRKQWRRAVLLGLAKFPRQQQMVVQMRVVDDMNPNEIAAALNLAWQMGHVDAKGVRLPGEPLSISTGEVVALLATAFEDLMGRIE